MKLNKYILNLIFRLKYAFAYHGFNSEIVDKINKWDKKKSAKNIYLATFTHNDF